MKALLLVFFGLVLPLSTAKAQETAIYDRMLHLEGEDRRTFFLSLSSHEQAEAMKTHVYRWIALNHQRFTPAQMLQVLKVSEYASEQIYRSGLKGEAEGAAMMMLRELKQFLSPEDIRDAFTLFGPHLAAPEQ